MLIRRFGLLVLLGLAQAADAISKTMTVERIDAGSMPTRNLRARSNQARQQRQQKQQQSHRQLATYTIPYSLLWRIEIGNGYPEPDRQPTDEEYEGVRSVTVDWFDEAHAEYYANSTDVEFVSTSCDLVPEETSWDAGEDYPHKIQLHCSADFEADALEDLPTNIDFILSINEDYDFEDFTREYLWNAPPPDNLFQYSQRVGYTLTDNGPSAPSGPATPTAPVPAPTPPPLAPVPGFSGLYVVPFAVQWDMAVGQNSVDREPTQEEYDGMLQATIDWFTDEINAYYADQSDTFTLNQFVASNEPPPSWTEGEQYPHRIPQDSYAIFNANSLDDVPSVLDLLQDVSANFDVTAYIEQYLRSADPADSIFREVTLVRYTSSTTTPAGPLTPDAPSAPVAAPTIPAPTPGAAVPTPATPPTPAAAVPTPAAPTPDVPAPTMGAPPTPAAAVPTPGAAVPTPGAADPSVPAPTRDVGPFPTNPPVTAGDGVVVLETVTAWKYAIGFGIPDRQPFLAEYEGYIDSTEAWLTKIYEEEYNDDDSTPTFVSLTSEIQSAEYDSLEDPAHTIILRTQYVFEVEDGQTAPSETELLMVISNANLMDYMLNYLHESEPRFNIFIGTKSVTWAAAAIAPTMPTPTTPVAAPVAPPVAAPTMAAGGDDPAPAPTMPEPTNAAPQPTPAPVAAPTPPPGPVENGGAADLSSLDSVRLFMTLDLAINLNRYEGDRFEPTDEEWDGLLLATKKFLTASFQEHYEGDMDSEFVGLQNVKWNSKSYSADDEKPYNGELQLDVAFMDGATLQPNSAYWTIINTFDFNLFLRQWVWTEAPADSIFHYASEVAWNYVNSQ